jgi:membrane associated rhomboid family serine protease
LIPLRDNISSKTTPIINWLLIAANIYIFFIELRMPTPGALDAFIQHWAVIPSRMHVSPLHYGTSLLTAAFLHAGWVHLIGNMLFLFVFGASVEDRMGHIRYFFFYLIIGMLANGIQAFLMSKSTIPLLGASGAIAGVLGAYFFYYPYARILTLIPIWIFSRIVEIPAFLFLGFWFILQTFNGTLALRGQPGQSTGGFVGGLILSPALSKKRGK